MYRPLFSPARRTRTGREKLFVLLTTEIKGFRNDGRHEPAAEEAFRAGDAFVVDYVRVFDIVK